MRSVSASRVIGLFAGVILLIAPGAALAGDEVLRGPEPAWVVTTVEDAPDTTAATAEGLRILLFDTRCAPMAKAKPSTIAIAAWPCPLRRFP